MPLGLWKSKWQLLREDLLRRDEEWWDRTAHRDEEWRTNSEARDEELRAATAERDREWRATVEARDEQWRATTEARDNELRATAAARDEEWLEWRAAAEERDREWREWRATSEARAEERHRELIAKLDENNRGIETALEILTKEVVGMRTEVHESTDSVKSQTEGIFRLIDRFDEFEGRRPPGPPPLRPV
jgi:hypothetical protein